MFHLIKEVRDIDRFKEILIVLFEEGFDYILARTELRHHIPVSKRFRSRNGKFNPEASLRRTLERLGPTFIKLGQILSVRPDLIPKSYCKELEKLQDNVEPHSYSEIKAIIEAEFGKKIDHIFKYFDKKPIASASISQVHKAALKTGEKVAVKIQGPGVKQLMETDIEIMAYFANILENKVEKLKKFRPNKIVSEFKEWTEKELDFRRESRNAKRISNNFKGSTTVHIPRIHDDYSTQRVLTLEFIDGIELNNVNEIKRKKLDFNKIIKNGFDAIVTQVFVHGVFHADPHPGNILVLKDSSIAFIDFGIVGYFDHKLKEKSVDLLYGIVEQDEELIMDTLLSMGMKSKITDYEQLKSDIGFIIQPLQNSSLKDLKVSLVLEEIIDLGLRHNIQIPTAFVLFGKTIVTLEGVTLEYDPNFKIIDSIKPFIEKIMIKRLSPLYIVKNAIHGAQRYKRFAEDFPDKAERALDRIEKGTFKVDVEDTDINKLALELDRSSNRVAYGLLIAALLITSAILMNLDKGPLIFEIPILSFIAFLFASFLIMILFISILREKFNRT
jgi:ubiquinone biosynthesis protein